MALRFSIIVPVRSDDEHPSILPSLAALEYPSDQFEVLIEAGPNPARNRNRAIARAAGDVFAFVDADCLVHPDWLARAARFLAAHPDHDVVGGPQLTPATDGFVARTSGYALASRFGAGPMSARYRAGRVNLDATQTELSSANLFVRRRALERVGMFDPRLWPNEETELLRRIEARGGRLAHVSDIVVFHRRRPRVRAFAVQCFGYGRGRARQSVLSGDPAGLPAVVPAIGLVALVSFVALLPVCPLLAGAPLASYALLTVAWSLAITAAERDPAAAVLLPVLFLALHVSYPAGFLVERVRLGLLGGLPEPGVGSRRLASRRARPAESALDPRVVP